MLPLSILNIAQAESLLIGFAMNLVLSSSIAIALLVAAGLGRNSAGKGDADRIRPVAGPPPFDRRQRTGHAPPAGDLDDRAHRLGLVVGAKPGILERAIGLGLLLAGTAVMVLYIYGYQQPPYHPLSRSMGTVAIGALKYLSLAVHPNTLHYWWPAGLFLLAILTATLHLLATVSSRAPGERPRAWA